MKIPTHAGSLLVGVVLTTAAAGAMDPLPSWNDGAAKQAIITFVQRVSTPGSSDFVPPVERIATFDNDGTLWAEQPIYFQFQFAIDRIKALAPRHPEWATQEPFNHLLEGDIAAFLAGGEKSLVAAITASHSGVTTEEFEMMVQEWLSTARHPKTGKRYTDMVYRPMLELLAYLRDNSFRTFIVSAGGVEFMRVFAEHVYGVPPERVIGSYGKLHYELRDGVPVLVKLPEVQFIDDNAGKPAAIQAFIGRRPLAAFGNSDGDLQMLQWTAAGPEPRLAVVIRHDDPVREWAYDRSSPVGQLDAAWDEAVAKHWVLVNMKEDWRRVFVFER